MNDTQKEDAARRLARATCEVRARYEGEMRGSSFWTQQSRQAVSAILLHLATLLVSLYPLISFAWPLEI